MPFVLSTSLAMAIQILGRQKGWAGIPLLLYAIGAILAIVVMTQPAKGADLTTQQEHGRQIYQSGISPAGNKIEAVLSDGETKLPASFFPCAKCHGENGRGGAEGGVTAAEITWHALTKPYQVVRADGRSRPPYRRESLLVRAITKGLDAGGKPLNPVMPRYRMSIEDAQSLVAYLKVVGLTAEIGVTAEAVKIGVILPPPGVFGPVGASIQKILDGYFAAVNESGEIYGRRVQLSTFVLPSAADSTAPSLRAFLNQDQPLAFVAPFMAGREQAIARVLQKQSVPASGALTLRLPSDSAAGGPLFYMLPDLAGEGRVLASFVSFWAPWLSSRPPGETLIVHAAGDLWREAADAIADELRHNGIKEAPHRMVLSADMDLEALVNDLSNANPKVVFLLAPGDMGRRFLGVLSSSGRAPVFLSPGVLFETVYSRAPLLEGSRLFLSWPVLPADQSPEGRAILNNLIPGSGTNRRYSNEQLSVVASAAVLVEGLRRTGRDLSRRKLIESLEGLYQFPTGFIRPITFGPNRRLGSAGAYVIEFDVKTGKALHRRWMDLK